MVTTEVIGLGASSVNMRQQVLHGRKSGDVETMAEGEVRLACVDSDTFKPKRIPAMVRDSLSSIEAERLLYR